MDVLAKKKKWDRELEEEGGERGEGAEGEKQAEREGGGGERAEEGVARVEWHARRGHEIVLVSGMVKPLARMVAMGLECELEARGVERDVLVSATRLEERGGVYTGKVLGEANYGEAKRRAMEVVARAMQI